MFKLLLRILLDEKGGTLAITRCTANTLITASGFNARFAEIEAITNGDIDATNLEDDAVTATKLASDVVRADYGLVQHTDGSLYVKTYGLINVGANGVAWGRAGDMLLSSAATTPDGFTDVSATYADKFIRISATALATGGADTHTHAAGSFTADSHTLLTTEIPAHTHNIAQSKRGGYIALNEFYTVADGGGSANTSKVSESTGGAGGHTHTVSGTTAAGSNVPAYITLRMMQHN